jgi:hypothetical protein
LDVGCGDAGGRDSGDEDVGWRGLASSVVGVPGGDVVVGGDAVVGGVPDGDVVVGGGGGDVVVGGGGGDVGGGSGGRTVKATVHPLPLP